VQPEQPAALAQLVLLAQLATWVKKVKAAKPDQLVPPATLVLLEQQVTHQRLLDQPEQPVRPAQLEQPETLD
jgi:hypothetical protein